jgi:Arc/MetJ-type ribon-helix-helix transcriptional regulator
MRITTVNLPEALHDQITEAARQARRSRSFIVRELLAASLSAQDRADALQAIAEHETSIANAPRAPLIISAASEAGHQHIDAMRKIARANQEEA